MKRLGICLLSVSLAVICQAGIITTDPGTGVTTTFTATGLTQGAGPFIINGFSVTGSNVAFGNVPFGLVNNGVWSSVSFVSGNTINTSITFDLGAPYVFVGGFMNYATPH